MQAQIWSDMNWKLIITLLMVSAILAYFGDRVGMRIGKKRISLFGLRPRHTSQIITAFTGVVISVGILLTMSVVSENVRTALFSMKFLQSQIINLTAELQESRDEAQLASIRLMESQSKLEEQEKKLLRYFMRKIVRTVSSGHSLIGQNALKLWVPSKYSHAFSTAVLSHCQRFHHALCAR